MPKLASITPEASSMEIHKAYVPPHHQFSFPAIFFYVFYLSEFYEF